MAKTLSNAKAPRQGEGIPKLVAEQKLEPGFFEKALLDIRIHCYLKRERDKQGLSIRDLAELTGLSISTLSEIENGKSDPRLSSVRKICKALGRCDRELWPEGSA